MKLVYAIKGGLFAVALSILIFFLKVICPLDAGCLVDPFIVVLFSPLMFFKTLHLTPYITNGHEPVWILTFWGMVGAVIGYLVAVFTPHKKQFPPEEGIV